MPKGDFTPYVRFLCTCCETTKVALAFTDPSSLNPRCDACRRWCPAPNRRHPQPCRKAVAS